MQADLEQASSMQANLESGSMQSGSMQSGSMQANLEQARAALTRARQMSESSDSQPETADIPGNFQSTVVSSAQMQQRLQEVQHLLDPNMQRLASLILPRPDCPCWPRAVVCATCVSHFLANSQRASTPSRSLSIALTPALQGMKNMIQPSAGGHIFHAISCNTIVVLGNKNIRINGALVNVEVATLRVAAFRNAFRYRKDSSPSGSTVRDSCRKGRASSVQSVLRQAGRAACASHSTSVQRAAQGWSLRSSRLTQ